MVSCGVPVVLLLLPWCVLARDQCHPCVCHGSVVDCKHRNLHKIPPLPQNITELDLSENAISDVPPGNLSHFSLLRLLDFSLNNLSCLHNLSFQGLGNLTELYLNDNRLAYVTDKFPSAVFQPLVSLQRLWLHNNIGTTDPDNQTYPDQALSSLTSLIELRLDGLPVLELGHGFSRMRNLRTLFFSSGQCIIKNLTQYFFQNVPGLENLSVANCYLTSINKDAFTPLSNLKELNMSHNEPLTLERAGESFYGLQNSSLESLDISKVEATFQIGVALQKRNVRYLSQVPLRKLWINSNRIQVLDLAVTSILPKTLEFISARDNSFTFGLYYFTLDKLTSLKVMDISQQFVTHIPHLPFEGVGSGPMKVPPIPLPPRLEYLDCSQTPIKLVLPLISFSTNVLHTANFSHNIVYQWIGPVYGLEHLQVVDLSNNFCDTLGPHFFSNFPALEVLNISSNFLGFALSLVADTVFANLTSLRVLKMADNKIRSLDRTLFLNLHNLTELDLSNNELATWEPDISNMKSLCLLDLHHNFLGIIPPNLTRQLDEIAEESGGLNVVFNDNNFYCTCIQFSFYQWICSKTSPVNVTGLENATCIDQNSQTRSLDDLAAIDAYLQHTCSNNAGLFMAVLSAVVVLLLLLVAALVYRYRWKLRYLYYMARWKKRDTLLDQQDFRYDAFISYADEDRGFVIKDMRRRLQEEAGLRLCIHNIHFLPGTAIAENILQAVSQSRKTVVVLSPDFLNSYWCDYEVQMAQMEEVYGRRSVLLVVLYRSVVRRRLSPTLLHVIRRDSYLEYPCDPSCPGDPPDPRSLDVFWHNLKSAIVEDDSP